MRDTVQLPDAVMDEPDELRAWLRKALDFTSSLPARAKKPAPKQRPKASPKKPKTKTKAKKK